MRKNEMQSISPYNQRTMLLGKKTGIKLQVIATHTHSCTAVTFPDANSDLLLVYREIRLCARNVFLCGNRFHICIYKLYSVFQQHMILFIESNDSCDSIISSSKVYDSARRVETLVHFRLDFFFLFCFSFTNVMVSLRESAYCWPAEKNAMKRT